jgi:cell division protein FtsB
MVGWTIVGVSCLLMVNALVGDNGYLATIRAQREYDALDASLARIRHENQQLRDRVLRMRHDPTALEEAARERQGLIKPGETVVVVKDPPAPSGAPPT